MGLLDWLRRQREKQKEFDARAAERRQHIREKIEHFKQHTAPLHNYVERKFIVTPEERQQARLRQERLRQMENEGRALGHGFEMGRMQARDQRYQRRDEERLYRNAMNPKSSFFDNYQDPFDTFSERRRKRRD